MTDYAVLIMAAAARHCGGVRVSAGQLAAETGLPVPTVQKLVSKLSGAGLMRSSRGVGGGLKLARPPGTITLADIVEAVEGPIALTACLDKEKSDCTLEGSCNVKGHWPQVNAAVRGALAQVVLTQLVGPQVAQAQLVEEVVNV
ncbi:BadM/Rrf2 family transcriptional regulator [Novosphingobium sp. Rr 2-17]|nr:BadM/Rrf2 family transcriptional regulator [Novosphingobium sp. Rr 2-17]